MDSNINGFLSTNSNEKGRQHFQSIVSDITDKLGDMDHEESAQVEMSFSQAIAHVVDNQKLDSLSNVDPNQLMNNSVSSKKSQKGIRHSINDVNPLASQVEDSSMFDQSADLKECVNNKPEIALVKLSQGYGI